MLVMIGCAATVPGGAGPARQRAPRPGRHLTVPREANDDPGAWAWVDGRGVALFLTGWVLPGL